MIWIIIIGFMVLGWVVSSRLKSKFKKYSQIPLQSNVSGAEAAQEMLHNYGIYDVQITCVDGQLTDHYNPADKTVNLSEEVFYGRNAAAVAVAAHECGHAVQHAQAYSFLQLRSALVPVQNVSAKILNVLFILSMISAFVVTIIPTKLALMAIVACYAVFSLFSLITLPVEFDASKRALAWIERSRIVNPSEYAMSKDALHWAAMTYVVAAASSMTMLAYYLLQLIGIGDD